jgi:hypothetical protein
VSILEIMRHCWWSINSTFSQLTKQSEGYELANLLVERTDILEDIM